MPTIPHHLSIPVPLKLVHTRPGLMQAIEAWLKAYGDYEYVYGGGTSWINGTTYPGAVYFKNMQDAIAFRLKFGQDLALCLA